MGLLTPVEQQTKQVFNMVPMDERLSILPRYNASQGLIAPQFIYDLAKAISTPVVAMQGQQVLPEEALNVAISSFGGSAAGVAPKGYIRSGLQRSTKELNKTEFEIASEIAQKNAVKMLGLPPGNTAMDRAKALGFTEKGYTGTNRDITVFDPSKAGSSGSGSREGGLGTWLTDDPRVASSFADWSARGQGGNVVYPLMIRGKNPKEFSSYQEIRDLVDANTQFTRPPYRMMQDTINYENAKKSLGDYGVLRNTMTDAIDTPITQYVVPDPSRLRSKYAAFDPARVNEADLLAMSGSPLPLGLLGKDNKEKKPKK